METILHLSRGRFSLTEMETTERQILLDYGDDIATYCGDNCVLIEPGSGSSEKVQFCLLFFHGPRAQYFSSRAAAYVNDM